MRPLLLLVCLVACSSTTVVAPGPGRADEPTSPAAADGRPASASAPAAPVLVLEVTGQNDTINGFASTETELFVSTRLQVDEHDVGVFPFSGGPAKRYIGTGSSSWIAQRHVVTGGGIFRWTSDGMARTPIEGGDDEIWVAPGAPGNEPFDDIVVGGDGALWSCLGDEYSCQIIRVDLTTKKLTNIVDVTSEGRIIRATKTHVAWTDMKETIWVKDLGSGRLVQFPIPKLSRARLMGFDVTDDAIFVSLKNENTLDGNTTGGSVKRVSLDGSDTKTIYEAAIDPPSGLAADAKNVYFDETIYDVPGGASHSRLRTVGVDGGDSAVLVESVPSITAYMQDAARVYYVSATTSLYRLDKR